jgi:hypothetical protein
VKLLLMLLLSCTFLAAGTVEGSFHRIAVPRIPFGPRSYVCYRAPRPIVPDGKLSNPAWRLADWSEEFVDIRGEEGPRPWYRTRVKMLWDDEYLYVGAELEEEHVWATLSERDSVVYQDNDFELFIDPDGDSHRYYELEINARGTVWDLFLAMPYRDDFLMRPALTSWDIQGLRSAVAVDGSLNDPRDRDRGWTVELAIPWKALVESAPRRKPPRPGDQWRMNFSRVEYRVDIREEGYVKAQDPVSGRPRDEENWVWSPQGLVNMHYPEMWGYVQFSSLAAGAGREPFQPRPEEEVKWALRRVYYSERSYREGHGSFTEDVGRLGLDPAVLQKLGPPVIKATPSLFEALYRFGEEETWHIRQDGLLWRGSEDRPDLERPNPQEW